MRSGWEEVVIGAEVEEEGRREGEKVGVSILDTEAAALAGAVATAAAVEELVVEFNAGEAVMTGAGKRSRFILLYRIPSVRASPPSPPVKRQSRAFHA